MQYRREIDGLRALAVLPVILFHAGFETFSGGFVGVDVFFVISGYLITTIIINELDDGKFSIINFYERRARRILPALFVVMLACLPFAWMWLLPSDMKDFSQSLVAVSLFASNILFWRESGYFAAAAELKPLLHTWSLAVEEQYYVLFPIFLLLTWRFGRRFVIATLAVIAIISLGLAEWGSTAKPAATFYLLPTRGWELLLGAFTAFYLSSHAQGNVSAIVKEIGSLLGLFLVLYSVFYFNASTPFPSLYTLAPTIGTVLIIALASNESLVGKVLGWKLFVGIGLISYSAYLWHQPLFAFAKHRPSANPSQLEFLALTLTALIFAYLSWHYIEKPFRNKNQTSKKTVFLFATTASIFFLALGFTGHSLNGFIGNFSGLANKKEYQDLTHRLRGNHGLNEACEKEAKDLKECRTHEEPEILLWGDSYAMHLAQGFLASNPEIKLQQITVSQCAPIIGLSPATAIFGAANCITGNDFALDVLRSKKSIKYAVLSSPSFLIGNSTLATRTGVRAYTNEEIEQELVNTLEQIKETGAIPIIFTPPPRNGEDIGQCLLRATLKNQTREACSFSLSDANDNQKALNAMLSRLQAQYQVIWLRDGLCKDNICKAHIGEALVYRDTGHLSYEGSAALGKAMNFYSRVKETTSENLMRH